MAPPAKRYSTKRSTQAGSSTQTQRTQTQRTQTLTQTQKGKRRADDEDEDEEEAEPEQEEGGGGDGEEAIEGDFDRRVSLLVRLALSVEHTRGSLKRDQINKVVFPNGGRNFNHVLTAANHNLRKVFGLELVELMTRAERDKVGAGEEAEEGEAEVAGPGRRKSKAGPSSKTYILRSALDASLIELANKPDAALTAAGEADLERLASKNKTVNPDEEETIASASRAGGSILGWDVGGEGEAQWYNVMSVILGLVLVNGRSVADNTLRGLLKPLGLTPSAEMFLPISNHRRRMKFPDFMTHLTKLGYLERTRAVTAGISGTQQPKKRGRQSQAVVDDDEDGSATEWRWGSRAHAEIGERAIAEFMVEFMVERAMKDAARQLRRSTQGGEDEDDDDEVGGAERSERAKDKAALKERGQKMREAMLRDVERSAGGNLSEAGKGVPVVH